MGKDIVFSFTKKQAHGWLIVFCFKEAVNRRNISNQLPHVLGAEFGDFDLHHYEAMNPIVVEKEVNILFCVSDQKAVFPSYKREAGTEFHQEALDVVGQSILQFFFVKLRADCQKIESVRVFC